MVMDIYKDGIIQIRRALNLEEKILYHTNLSFWPFKYAGEIHIIFYKVIQCDGIYMTCVVV
jgi:hypothetical protein